MNNDKRFDKSIKVTKRAILITLIVLVIAIIMVIMQFYQKSKLFSVFQQGDSYSSVTRKKLSSEVKQTTSSENLKSGIQQSKSSNYSTKQSKNTNSVIKQSESSKSIQTKPNCSNLAQKLIGDWEWYANDTGSKSWQYLIEFKSDGTCEFDSCSPFGGWYSGTYKVLDDDTIFFKGIYNNNTQPENPSNIVKICEAKLRIEWLKKDHQHDAIYSDTSKKMKLILIDGTSPLSLSKDAMAYPYFVG